MRSAVKISMLLATVCILASGCATMRYPSVFKIEGMEVKEFKELDDDRVVRLIVSIYNIKHEGWDNGIARSISLEEYLALARKRNSAYIIRSGVFDLEFEEVKISKWSDEDLKKLYRDLLPKARRFYMDSASELTEIQNSDRVMYLTAINAVIREMQKRKNTHDVINVASQVLMGLLTVALAMI